MQHALAMAEDATPPTTPTHRRSGCGRMLGILLVGALVTAGFVAWKFMDVAKQSLSMISGNFVTQDINQVFRQSVTEIASTQGDILEVATLQTDETVTKYDMKSVFNQSVYLGTTTSEIRVPVVYRYHIKLSGDWKLNVEDGHCIVRAPELRPTLPPAIRTEGMEKKSEAGWLRFNAAESLAELEKNLTSTLENRAGSRGHFNLVREPSRKSVAEFVKKWVLAQHHTSPNNIKSITVLFPDEVPAKNEPRLSPITISVP